MWSRFLGGICQIILVAWTRHDEYMMSDMMSDCGSLLGRLASHTHTAWCAVGQVAFFLCIGPDAIHARTSGEARLALKITGRRDGSPPT